MVVDDIRLYLREFGRLLAEGGAIFVTAFIEESVPDMTENPSNYRRKWTGDLHCVRLSRLFWERLLRESELRITQLTYESETDGKSGVYISR